MTPGDIDFKDAAGRLHTEVFGRIANSPWYSDAVYERFSDAEYQRRFDVTQAKMKRLGLDVLIASRRSQSLELGRRDALAQQPLGVAWDVGVCRRTPRW